ncbi:hypothetical protein BJX68DRAFT_248394 [Aspergillus pseudodeflectus]|uniref:Uncharacterized protein n=1 Tax=Aspergillus pseudodeflectus TaxID=176178 RepID=A0ABR4JFZ7_9EURO
MQGTSDSYLTHVLGAFFTILVLLQVSCFSKVPSAKQSIAKISPQTPLLPPQSSLRLPQMHLRPHPLSLESADSTHPGTI